MRGKRSVNTLEMTKSMVYVALFAALTAVLSQISIPMPAGIPLTLQTFAIAFAGFYLGFGKGLQCVFVYVLLGVCGVPVFASFTGGAAKLVGATGGFIWGFFALAAMTGAASETSGRMRGAACVAVGIVALHALGTAQFAAVTGTSLSAAALAVSVPFVAKDLLSVLLASALTHTVKSRLSEGCGVRVRAELSARGLAKSLKK